MDFLVYHMEQHLFVDVYDSDLLSKDDLLGYVCVEGERRPRISDLDDLPDTWTKFFWSSAVPVGTLRVYFIYT